MPRHAFRSTIFVVAVTMVLACESSTADAPAGATSTQTVASALALCAGGDSAALWKGLTPAFQATFEREAANLGQALSPAEIAEAYGYDKPITRLDGQTFLDVSLSADGEHENPCWRAKEWKQLAEDGNDRQHAVLYELPNGHGRGVVLERDGDSWRISKITKSLRPEQYATVVPGYVPGQ